MRLIELDGSRLEAAVDLFAADLREIEDALSFSPVSAFWARHFHPYVRFSMRYVDPGSFRARSGRA